MFEAAANSLASLLVGLVACTGGYALISVIA